jgi:hypothetical protein
MGKQISKEMWKTCSYRNYPERIEGLRVADACISHIKSLFHTLIYILTNSFVSATHFDDQLKPLTPLAGSVNYLLLDLQL